MKSYNFAKDNNITNFKMVGGIVRITTEHNQKYFNSSTHEELKTIPPFKVLLSRARNIARNIAQDNQKTVPIWEQRDNSFYNNFK